MLLAHAGLVGETQARPPRIVEALGGVLDGQDEIHAVVHRLREHGLGLLDDGINGG